MLRLITLKDGRTLAFEEYGDSQGKPVFYFHGWPASRLSGQTVDTAAKKLRLRIISCDRPGFGLSTFKPGRKLLDWPDDITELADNLGIKRFSIIGSSGGGPYVSVCAYKIPKRLTSVAIFAGLGPLKVKDKEGLTSSHWFLLKLAAFLEKNSLPSLFLYQFFTSRFPGLYCRYSSLGRPKPDREILQDDILKTAFGLSAKEAFRQGVKGPLQDMIIYSSDWGFDLKDISLKILLWHGELDKNVPVWMAKYVASRLKNCESTFVPEAGHFLMALMGEEMLAKL